jgi:hypothetical protein
MPGMGSREPEIRERDVNVRRVSRITAGIGALAASATAAFGVRAAAANRPCRAGDDDGHHDSGCHDLEQRRNAGGADAGRDHPGRDDPAGHDHAGPVAVSGGS